MSSVLRIKIVNKTPLAWLMWVLILFPFCFGTLNDLLGLPRFVRYFVDAAWLSAFVVAVSYSPTIKKKWEFLLVMWIGAFFLYTLIVYFVEYQSVFYYLWGFRNVFRFYIAFFVFSRYLRLEYIERYLDIFDVLFWVNLVAMIFQYFVLDLEQDFLGGVFGIERGCNGYSNIFFIIVVTKSILFYLDKRESFTSCGLKCVAALLVSALAELKLFFVEFVIILILTVLISRFTWRKLWVIVGGIAGLCIGVVLLTTLFPRFAGWFSVEWFLENAMSEKGYTGHGDLNRLNSISQINQLWFETLGNRIFGFGLGNCDTANFSIVNTPFYIQYQDLHYTWISYAFMYLECGWIGLIFYFGFFLLCFMEIQRIEKACYGKFKLYCYLAKIMALFCLLFSIYNNSLRAESGYMAYFVMAIPFALSYQKSNYIIKQFSNSKMEENVEKIRVINDRTENI